MSSTVLYFPWVWSACWHWEYSTGSSYSSILGSKDMERGPRMIHKFLRTIRQEIYDVYHLVIVQDVEWSLLSPAITQLKWIQTLSMRVSWSASVRSKDCQPDYRRNISDITCKTKKKAIKRRTSEQDSPWRIRRSSKICLFFIELILRFTRKTFPVDNVSKDG